MRFLFFALILLSNALFAQNFVVNGDFSQGKKGFTTSYKEYQSGKPAPGLFTITTNPASMNGAYCNIGDHTSGTGKMMVVDISEHGGDVIWQQTVAVKRSTEYMFTVSASALYAYGDPVVLEVRINGEPIMVEVPQQGDLTCRWQRYYTTWPSREATAANIEIVSPSSSYLNSDLAIDDIRFFKEGTESIDQKGKDVVIMTETPPRIAVLEESVEEIAVVDAYSPDVAMPEPVDETVASPVIEPVRQVGVVLMESPRMEEIQDPLPLARSVDPHIAHPLPKGTKNLIVNGDFSKGNTGFVTSYTVIPPGEAAPNRYAITTDPVNMNGHYCSLKDHTTADGNMMVIDGSTQGPATIWSQEVKVKPGQTYVFSLSAASLYGNGDPAIVVVEINKTRVLLQELPQGNLTCEWQQYMLLWNSDRADTASISIYSASTAYLSNDLALDDIQLYTATKIKPKKPGLSTK